MGPCALVPQLRIFTCSLKSGVAGVVQNDVWNAFKDASFFGLEVYTEHGPRAPTSAIYIPVLSGCRLFVSKDQQVGVPA